jgi:signal transduction histidine kinase
VLVVARARGQPPFSDGDLRQLEALAAQTAVALEHTHAKEALERLAVVADRERIGRDLHDTVIQRLFSSGLSLQAVAQKHTADDPEAAARIHAVVDELDTTIRDIRTAIFTLQSSVAPTTSLRAVILQVAAEAARPLGFEPRVHFDGPLDTVTSARTREHLVATLREALSNVARHAGANRVDIHAETDGAQLILEVADDGVGIGDGDSAGSGLVNMSHRADELGGDCNVHPGVDGGTVVTWRVPVR